MTLAKLGEKVGIEPSSLGNIENGYNYPKMSTLEELANALDCKISDFFVFEHLNTNENLIAEINEKLLENPDKVKDIYKIILAITK